MLAGISITCFAASYLVALLLELTRLWFRSGVRGALMLGFAGAGFVAHTLFLGYRAATQQGAPLSSEFDWFLVAAWLVAGLYLAWTAYQPLTSSGLFLLPLVLLIVLAAAVIADRAPQPAEQARSAWVAIHSLFQLLGVVTVLAGFVSGVMCLVQVYRLKHGLPPRQGFRLPSLEWLEQVNLLSIVWSCIFLGLGFLTGLLLNYAKGQIPWNDPVVWRSAALMGWLLTVAVFVGVYKPARQSRKSSYLTIATFAAVVLSLSIDTFFPSEHRPARPPQESRQANADAPTIAVRARGDGGAA